MRIDIHRPELEAIIHERLQSGVFKSAEDVIWQAFRDSAQPEVPTCSSGTNNLAELFEPIQGLLTDEEVDVLFSRNPSTGRPVDLG